MDTGIIGASEDEALQFHAGGRPGKLSIAPTKPLTTQRDLTLAYSPGVAFPCLHIHRQPGTAFDYTSKGNFVAAISNGTAVLGLGDLGALAAKPVMEGKCALFKRFADIDSIDLEIDTRDVDEFVNCVRFLHPAFGGINLEDIKAPECFIIEERLRELLDIPVFHDDQHGTAIIAAAGLINALHLTGRELQMTDCWVNIMPRRTAHALHLHPHSTLSGTYYVQVPRGSPGTKFEDPRLDRFMAAPSRKADASSRARPWITFPAAAGHLVLFESWLRHEVVANSVNAERISVSFNYNWF